MQFHHNSHMVMHKFLHDKMSKIYLYHAISTFARSLIGIFVPVYLFSLGFPVITILAYSMGQSIIFLLTIPATIKIIKKIGFKYTLLLTTPVYILHILTLNYISDSIIYFHLSWFTFGLFTGLFWPAYHSEIALSGSRTHRSSQMGTLQILATLFGTLSPIVGGYFLEFTNFIYLMLFTTIILILGTIPLLTSKDINLQNYSFSYSKYLQLFKSKKHKNSKKAFAYNGIYSSLVLYIWPIILFLLLTENFFKYGTLLTAVSLLSTFIILYVKAFFDKGDKNKILKQTNVLLSFNWFFKSIIFIFGTIFLYIIESIYKLLINTFNMVYLSIFYNNAKKHNFMDYIILREFYLHLTRIAFSTVLIVILSIYGESIITLSAIAFSGVFMSLGFNCFREEKASM